MIQALVKKAPWSFTLALIVTLAPLFAYGNPFSIARYNGLVGGPFDRSPFALYWNPARLTKPGARLALLSLIHI